MISKLIFLQLRNLVSMYNDEVILFKMRLTEVIICIISAVLAQVDNDYDDEDIRLPDEATGRPVPPELMYVFGNKSARDQDLEVCMGELLDCHHFKYEVSKSICARHSKARKTFKDLCELNYENCKAPIIDSGFDDTAGPEHLKPITVNPEVEIWEFSHDGECSSEHL